jgi:hypothetical protein
MGNRSRGWHRRPTPIELGNGVVIESMSPAELRADYLRRRVAETIIRQRGEMIRVSTVKLHHEDLFETVVFGGPLDGWRDQLHSRTMAKYNHQMSTLATRIGIAVKQRQRARLRRMHAAYRRKVRS